MKVFIILALCLTTAFAYSVRYETSDGLVHEEEGHLKNLGDKEGPVEVFQGFSQYVAPDGKTYRTDYTADERGFVAKGSHLPTSPPIPPEILKSLNQVPK